MGIHQILPHQGHGGGEGVPRVSYKVWSYEFAVEA